MKDPLDPRLEQYLALCQRMYERLLREGNWPWPEENDADTGDEESP